MGDEMNEEFRIPSVIRRDRFRFTFWLLAYVAASWFPDLQVKNPEGYISPGESSKEAGMG